MKIYSCAIIDCKFMFIAGVVSLGNNRTVFCMGCVVSITRCLITWILHIGTRAQRGEKERSSQSNWYLVKWIVFTPMVLLGTRVGPNIH